MAERVPRSEYPWWVKLSMWGVPGRAGLWFFVALSVAAAIACVAYGFVDPRFFAGGLFLFSALMYLLSIRWVDRYGSWVPDAEPGAAPDPRLQAGGAGQLCRSAAESRRAGVV